MIKQPLFLLLALIASPSFSVGSIDSIHQDRPYGELECSIVEDAPVYGLSGYSLDAAICDGRAMAWLSKELRAPSNAEVGQYVVVDQITLGTLRSSESFFSPYCSLGKPTESFQWIAVYRWKPKSKNTLANGGIIAGWVINKQSKRFELIKYEILKKIVCQAEDD
jgi:hypothetical protein